MIHDDLPDITYDVGKQHAGWVDGNQSWEGIDQELFRGDLFHYFVPGFIIDQKQICFVNLVS